MEDKCALAFGRMEHLTIVVLGASGDLAKKKTFPALFSLFANDCLPPSISIVGYARSHMSTEEFRQRLKATGLKAGDPSRVNLFLEKVQYLVGSYDKDEDFLHLETELQRMTPKPTLFRIFYLALPPTVFIPVATRLRQFNYLPNSVHRLIVEKPFGHDLESARVLGAELSKLWSESELYRIDHYLGKEMVKNLVSLRFANTFFSAIWNAHAIANVQITFKETIGTQGRGGYFDPSGIIRDVMQNHLLQILALTAMEAPSLLSAEEVRNEKVKVLQCIPPVTLEETFLGQYVGSGTQPGYTDDPTVPEGSLTPTFAACVLHIENERWGGVPFVLKCGKALNEAKTEIRVQFKDRPRNLFPNVLSRNELVIRVQPQEAVYLKLMNKVPGLSYRQHISELNLSYTSRYEGVRIPDAYESLLLDVIQGDQANFVRNDELEAAWKIFTPLLHAMENTRRVPEPYPFGARAPEKFSDFLAKTGVVRDREDYIWPNLQTATSEVTGKANM